VSRTLSVLALVLIVPAPGAARDPLLLGHRGLVHDAPENTLSAFAACLELRIGFEVDVRRSKDRHLVCVHDDALDRTTDGKGKVADRTLEELKKLDAGSWFHPAFRGERVPTLDEVLGLVKGRARGELLVALDLKVTDATLAADIAKLAQKHGLGRQLLCIGTAISDPELRRALRKESKELGIAVLAMKEEDLGATLKDEPADWLYLRFVPAKEQVEQAHKARKQVIMVGPVVLGREPGNWNRAREAGVDALLTDFPLECRQGWRPPAAGNRP
jgi:glycerophosphoryl diester phosphodiesterase